MEEKKVTKLKLSIIISILLIVLIIASVTIFIVFSKKIEISMSKTEIMKIANDNKYEIKDEQLKRFSNDLLNEETLIVSKQSANSLKEAKKLSMEYKDKLNEGISKDDYESYTNFEYIDLVEATYYYKFIGEYSYKYMRTSTDIVEISPQYVFLVFKSDYFEYPYLKKYNDDISIKEFGDILSVINYGNNKIIKSEIKDNKESFTYNLYYISKNFSKQNGVDKYLYGVNYYLKKATFTVNKSTGKTDLYIKQKSFLGDVDYKNSYYPYMHVETIKSFFKEGKEILM